MNLKKEIESEQSIFVFDEMMAYVSFEDLCGLA